MAWEVKTAVNTSTENNWLSHLRFQKQNMQYLIYSKALFAVNSLNHNISWQKKRQYMLS